MIHSEYARIADAHGIRLLLVDAAPQYSWDGAGAIRVRNHGDDLCEVAHEIAHYLLATSHERRFPEYTLGKSPWANEKPPRCRCLRKHSQVESSASALGIWLMLRIESRDSANATLEAHNWDIGAFVTETRALLRSGYLIRRFGKIYPRCLVRAARKRDIYRRAPCAP